MVDSIVTIFELDRKTSSSDGWHISANGCLNSFKFKGIVHDYLTVFDGNTDKRYYFSVPSKNFARLYASSTDKSDYVNLDKFRL